MPGHPSGEQLVQDRLESILPVGARLLRNVRWIGATRPDGPARDGEIDVLIVSPQHGILVIEVKNGRVERDSFGRWYAGSRALDVSPFRQAETSKHAIRDKILARSDWTGGEPRMMHAVAFPEMRLDSLPRGTSSFGPDSPVELVIDGRDLEGESTARKALERIFAYWSGDGAREQGLDPHQVEIITDILEPQVTLRRLLRDEIEQGRIEILAPTHYQLSILNTLRRVQRASIAGGAGSGKTLLAVEKARQLASENFRVLFICFNSPLAASVAADPELAKLSGGGYLTVSTFHELCRRLGEKAAVLPPTPADPDRDWFDTVLPRALDQAIGKVDDRWNAIVVDEGQDLDASWLFSLDLLLAAPGEGVFYLFHDPAQALYRPDATSTLGLQEFPLGENCRNPRPIHEFACRWYSGGERPEPMRDDGREPEVIIAESGEETLEAVRATLHRLVHLERIDRRSIVVLIGVSLDHSEVWKRRRFKGDLKLWNGNPDRKLPADRVPPQPFDTILCETIHRFKGLEADVVVLVELRADDARLPMLLYIGASRARQHLVLIATPALAGVTVPSKVSRTGATL